MTRLIDADELKNRLQERSYADWFQGLTMQYVDVIWDAIYMVEQSPTIETEQKTGKWIETAEDWRHQIHWWTCSECGQATSERYKFCPSCGAAMMGEEE